MLTHTQSTQSTQPSLRSIRRAVVPLIARAASVPGADRYRKHFPARAHLWILLLHVLTGSQSLRQTYGFLTPLQHWWQAWGLPRWISFSQLARSSTSRPSACLEVLFSAALAEARRQPSTDPRWRKLLRIEAMDRTVISLAPLLSPWSQHGQAAAGVHLQCGLDLAHALPSSLRLTGAETNDHTALWERDLEARRGWTLLFDRGYYGHRQFVRLLDAGVHFITRLSPQASFTLTDQRRVPVGPTPDGDTILMDATLTLGSAENRRGAVVPGLRLVVSQNARGIVHWFVTDRHDLAATEVVQLYRARWRIELFFRWLKHQLGARAPLGRSREAVWLTILIVLIVALLYRWLLRGDGTSPSQVADLRGFAMLLLIILVEGG